MAETFAPWQNYWKSKTVLETDRGAFNLYSIESDADFVLLCIHGAGHSALSFSLLAKEVSSIVSVFAPDLKCHGETPGDAATDLSIDNLVADVVSIANAITPEGKRLLILGHSLGGSIATKAAHVLKPAGLFVLDTIEGIAIAAMPGMRHILSSRPQSS